MGGSWVSGPGYASALPRPAPGGGVRLLARPPRQPWSGPGLETPGRRRLPGRPRGRRNGPSAAGLGLEGGPVSCRAPAGLRVWAACRLGGAAPLAARLGRRSGRWARAGTGAGEPSAAASLLLRARREGEARGQGRYEARGDLWCRGSGRRVGAAGAC